MSVALGAIESYGSWDSFLADMKERGLNDPLLILTDGFKNEERASDFVYRQMKENEKRWKSLSMTKEAKDILYGVISLIAQNILRTLRQVVRSNRFNWIYTFRLDRIMCVAAIIFVVDMATFMGTFDWFRDRKTRENKSCVRNFWTSS